MPQVVINMLNKEIKVIYKSGLVREYSLKRFLSFSQLTINDLCNNDKLKEQGIKEVKLINNPFSSLDLSLIKKAREEQNRKIRESLNGLYEGLKEINLFSSLGLFSALDKYRLKLLVYKKAIYIYEAITQKGIKDVVLVNQDKDKDSLCCAYLIREFLGQIKKEYNLDVNYDKQVLYKYKGQYNITSPLTNYYEGSCFKFDDDKLYIFCDNGLSQEAIEHFKIKNYVAFDNHTHIITDKTEIEKEIIKSGLGDRNYIGATQEPLSLLDKENYVDDWALFSNCDSANSQNNFKNSKGQLKSLGLEIKVAYEKIEMGQISFNNKGVMTTDKEEFSHLMLKGEFKETKENNNYISLEPLIEGLNTTQEKVKNRVKKELKINYGYEFDEARDKIIIYNDNKMFYGGLNVNVLVYREGGFSQKEKLEGFYF